MGAPETWVEKNTEKKFRHRFLDMELYDCSRCEPCFIHKNELTSHPCSMSAMLGTVWIEAAVTRSPCAELLRWIGGVHNKSTGNMFQFVSHCLDIRVCSLSGTQGLIRPLQP